MSRQWWCLFRSPESVLRVPVSVPYTVHSLAGNNVTAFVPEQHAEGLLQWDQQPGAELNLTIPSELDSHSPQAEHRLGLSFGPAWNAVVTGGPQPDRCAHLRRAARPVPARDIQVTTRGPSLLLSQLSASPEISSLVMKTPGAFVLSHVQHAGIRLS